MVSFELESSAHRRHVVGNGVKVLDRLNGPSAGARVRV